MQWRFGNFEKWAEDNESTPLSLVANAHDEIIIIVRDKLTKYCFHTEALGSHLTFANDVLLLHTVYFSLAAIGWIHITYIQ